MSNKKTVLICSTSFCEYDRRILRIIDSLTKNGYAVKWASRRSKDSPTKNESFTHYCVNTFFKSGPLFYLEINLRFFILVLLKRYDIVHLVDLDSLPGGYLPPRLRGKHIFFDAHEIFYEVPELSGKRLKKKIWKAVARMFVPNIKNAITVNASLKHHYRNRYGTDFKVVRNIPPLNHKNIEFDPNRYNKKTIIYIGALNEGRGLEIAIDAMPHLKDYRLILVGEGDLSVSLRHRANSSPATERIKFTGFVSPDELSRYLEQASIGINMLRADSLNYKLSLGNKFFDYIHAALPSIHMQYPEYELLNKQYNVAELVGDYTKAGLLKAIQAMENINHYNLLQQNCLEVRKVLNWQKEQEQLLMVYKQINP